MEAAEKNAMSEAMKDRLRLTEARLSSIAAAVRECAALPDPVGRVLDGGPRPNGILIRRVSVPLGVVGLIFEARPNVCVDCAVLCLKAGNAAILRGGKEAINSNTALAAAMRGALEGTSIPADAIQLVEDTSRETAAEMMRLNGYIDVLIPRGGAGLIQSVVKNSTVPVIETGVGNCHAFIDESADHDMAVRIVDNAKTSRPGVCNALETLLVHRAAAKSVLPAVKAALDRHGVRLRGCEETRRILGDSVEPATQEDYFAEYNDYILAVRVVGDIMEAVGHIRKYSTGHSETIITRDIENAEYFTKAVDSAAVYVNASTRFTDGGEFGLGAEIGISTQKLHARGPMGLRELTSYKYIITGNGQTR
jgi:glutamate-5-semialdehyde dehydrogenase